MPGWSAPSVGMSVREPWSYDSNSSHVFVCYSHANRSTVLNEIRDLHDQGFNLWFDESGMHAGSEWPEELANAIGNCHCFLSLKSAVLGLYSEVQHSPGTLDTS